MAHKNHPTVYQEAGFFALEFFWLHAVFEHKWPTWWAFFILFIGVLYSRYGTTWAVKLHNGRVVGQKNEFVRWLMIVTLVSAIIAIPWGVLKIVIWGFF